MSTACPSSIILRTTLSNKSSAVAEIGDRGHNRHGPKRWGLPCPFRAEPLTMQTEQLKLLGVTENWLKGRRQRVCIMVKFYHSLEWSVSGFSTRSTVIFDFYQWPR